MIKERRLNWYGHVMSLDDLIFYCDVDVLFHLPVLTLERGLSCGPIAILTHFRTSSFVLIIVFI